MMDAKKLMWDVGCGELTGDFYAVTPAQLENIIAKVRADALAQQGEAVCYGCGIPAGDVHMSTCQSGKWPSRVSNGDTAAPAPAPAPAPAQGGVTRRKIFACVHCHGIYADQTVTQCDCMEGTGADFVEGFAEYPSALQSAQPVASVPLTDKKLKDMWLRYCGYPGGIFDFARAVETTHGIKEVK